MRVSGLASGMDIDTMVKDLMKAERIPLDTLRQKKQVLEWKRDDYRSMNTLLLNFRSELTNIKLSSTFRARGTTSSDETKITATATSAASLSSYSISKVDRLASAASKVNTGTISANGQKIDPSKALTETPFADSNFNWQTGSAQTQTVAATTEGTTFKLTLKDGVSVQNTAPMNVKVNGVSYEVTNSFTDPTKKQVMVDGDGNLTFNQTITKDSSIKVDFVSSHSIQEMTLGADTKNFTLSKETNHSSSSITSIKITSGTNVANYSVNGNTIEDGGVAVGTIDRSTGIVTMNSDILKDSKIEVSYEQQYSSFSIKTFGPDNAQTIENFNISGMDSVNSILNKVNTSNVGVTMFYDSVSDKMTLSRKETGDFNKTTEGSGQEIITSGAIIDNVFKFGGASETGGVNAKFTINGLDTERTSNTFEISGVTITLNKTFSDAPATININNNTTQIFDNIKGFVEKYNELISKIQAEVQEERYKSYTPLTDEQRESLSDKQQEQWEEKAKSGLLRRDPTLNNILTKMRNNFSNPVSNEEINPMFKQLASIGIKTSSNYLEGGKLIINEAELKKAIETDPESVEKLFNATGTTEGEKGIAQRLTDTVSDGLDKLREKAGNSFNTNNQFEIGKQLLDLDKRINKFEDRLIKVEDRYWKQFTAMEKAIQRSNEQMNQLLNYSG